MVIEGNDAAIALSKEKATLRENNEKAMIKQKADDIDQGKPLVKPLQELDRVIIMDDLKGKLMKDLKVMIIALGGEAKGKKIDMQNKLLELLNYKNEFDHTLQF